MIPINEINLFECPFGNTNNTISNAYIPSTLIAWNCYITQSNITCSNINDVKTINEGIIKLTQQIRTMVSDIVKTNQDTNYNPEISPSMIDTYDDLFVRKYQSTLRCIQDCYHIISLAIQVFIPLNGENNNNTSMNNEISQAINTLINSNIENINELFSKVLYLCPTLYSINTAQWVELQSSILDVRSIIFFLIAQIQSYNKRVKMVSSKRLSDKQIKSFAAILVDIIDDMQENNIDAISYHIRTHLMSDILKQDWESDKEFRRGQCYSYGITASIIVIRRLLNDIKTRAYRYPFFYINCSIQLLKVLVEIIKEEYLSISNLSRIKSKQFVLDLKYLVVSAVDILHFLQNDSLCNAKADVNNDGYLWYGKKQGAFILDFVGSINNVRNKVLSSNTKIFTINESLLEIGFENNSNTTFSEQIGDQELIDLILVILEVQFIIFLLDNNYDDDSIMNMLDISTANQLFSIQTNERVGLDTIINLGASDFNFDENFFQNYNLEYNIERILKYSISRDILSLVTINAMHLNLILSKHYVCIGDDNHLNFPLLTEQENIIRNKIQCFYEKVRLESNYISLD